MLEPFLELYRHQSTLPTNPSLPPGLHQALDYICSTDVSSTPIPLTLRIQLCIGILSDLAITAGLVKRGSLPSQHCLCFQDSYILCTAPTCLGCTSLTDHGSTGLSLLT
jgi:hypothetical protein